MLVVVLVYARWNTYVSGDDDDDLELYEQCFELLVMCNASNLLWCVMLSTPYDVSRYVNNV